MALKIALKPGEKFVINGSVVQNGDRRTTLMIHNRSAILREKDIMRAEDASTPSRRIYFAIQMMYLDHKVEQTFYREFVQRISEFINAIRNEEALNLCMKIIETVHANQFYDALMLSKKVIKFEDSRLQILKTDVVTALQSRVQANAIGEDGVPRKETIADLAREILESHQDGLTSTAGDANSGT